jgi:spermidine synthase
MQSPLLLVDRDSPHQHVRLSLQHDAGLQLHLDGARQFIEREEYRYHESLAVVPFLFREPRRVFVGGGGDGLVAARLVKFDCVEEIVLCDHDEVVTQLAREQPDLVRLNECALSDVRIRIVNDDAQRWLERSSDSFDLVICDFPDPFTRELARLYSREFYQVARERLRDDGLLITQLCALPESAAIARSTLRSVFAHEYFFKTRVYGFREAAFGIGSPIALGKPGPVPAWTRYLNDATAGALFALPKDEEMESHEVNTDANPALAKATLIAALEPGLGAPYPYDPHHFVVMLDEDTPYMQKQVLEGLGYLDERRPLIIYLEDEVRPVYEGCIEALGYVPRTRFVKLLWRAGPASRAAVERYWKRLDDGSRTSFDLYRGVPGEHPEVRSLFSEYLERYGRLFLDAPATVDVMQEPGLFAVSRDPAGRPCGLAVLLLGDEIQFEAGFDRGSRRQLVLSFLLLLRYLLEEEPDEEITMWAPGERAATMMESLGAKSHGMYGVWVRRSDRGREWTQGT